MKMILGAWLPLAILATAGLAGSLEPGKKVEGRIAGGESREFLFTLAAGDYARLTVEQPEINLAITLVGPDGGQLFTDDWNWIGYPEVAELVASCAGVYRLRVTAPDSAAAASPFSVRLEILPSVTAEHQRRAAAFLSRARALNCPQKLPCFEEALVQCRQHCQHQSEGAARTLQHPVHRLAAERYASARSAASPVHPACGAQTFQDSFI